MATPNDITAILSYFSKGYQRTNRFAVEIVSTSDIRSFWATSVQIPSQSIIYYPETFSPSGPSIFIPLKREYDERFLIDFIVESDWSVRNYFENWYNIMFDPGPITDSRRSSKVNTREIGLRNINIKAYNENGKINAKFTLYEAFPKLLLPSQFSQDTPNQYLTLTVDFNYRYYAFDNKPEQE